MENKSVWKRLYSSGFSCRWNPVVFVVEMMKVAGINCEARFFAVEASPCDMHFPSGMKFFRKRFVIAPIGDHSDYSLRFVRMIGNLMIENSLRILAHSFLIRGLFFFGSSKSSITDNGWELSRSFIS